MSKLTNRLELQACVIRWSAAKETGPGPVSYTHLAVGIVVLNIAVAMALYFILGGRIELPMIVGILYLSLIHIFSSHILYIKMVLLSAFR